MSTVDPALRAAMKAMLTVESPTVRDTAVAAAREALKPIRELVEHEWTKRSRCGDCSGFEWEQLLGEIAPLVGADIP